MRAYYYIVSVVFFVILILACVCMYTYETPKTPLPARFRVPVVAVPLANGVPLSLPDPHTFIPPFIYRTWKHHELRGIRLSAWRRTERASPSTAQILFSDADIDAFFETCESLPDRVVDAYFKINPRFGAARADFFRYALLYERGGMYLDAKSYAVGDLARLRRTGGEFVLAHWKGREGHVGFYCRQGMRMACKYGEFLQWFLACRSRHPFLRQLLLNITDAIENFDPSIYPPCKSSVLRLTGPTAYTTVIHTMIDNGFRDYTYMKGGIRDYVRYSITNDWDSHIQSMYTGSGEEHYSRVRDDIVLSSVDLARKAMTTRRDERNRRNKRNDA